MIRLSTMFDCWKNNCQGATVVPTTATIKRMAEPVIPPRTPGTNPRRIGPAAGWARKKQGMTTRLATTSSSMNRSQRRNLPVAAKEKRSTAAAGTLTYCEIPK